MNNHQNSIIFGSEWDDMKLCSRMFPWFSQLDILPNYLSQISWGEEYKYSPFVPLLKHEVLLSL